MKGKIIMFGVIFLLVFASLGFGAVTKAPIAIHGKLSNPSTGDLYDGTFATDINIYDAETGGNLVEDGAAFVLTVSNGFFYHNIEVDPSNFDIGKTYWLEMEISGVTMPRVKLTYNPYSIKALEADTAGSVGIADNANKLGGAAASSYLKKNIDILAIGKGASTHINSIAIGTDAVSVTENTIAIGTDTQSNKGSIAIGNGADALGDKSIAIGVGANVRSIDLNSIALGRGASTSWNNEFRIGSSSYPLTTYVSGKLVVQKGGSANRAVCWKGPSGQTLGYCSSAVQADGSCECN